MLHILSWSLLILNWMLCIVVLIALTVRRINHDRLYFSKLRRDIWMMSLFWTLASVVATLERVFDIQTDSPTILSIAALLVTMRILWYYDKNWHDIKKRGVR